MVQSHHIAITGRFWLHSDTLMLSLLSLAPIPLLSLISASLSLGLFIQICLQVMLWNQCIAYFEITWSIVVGETPNWFWTVSHKRHWLRALSCTMCRWFTVSISHKPKSIYFQSSLFSFCTEKAWASLISILLQLATDASSQSANPNCTWWAKLIALVLLDLPTAVRGNFFHSSLSDLIQPHTHIHTLLAPQYLKMRMAGGTGSGASVGDHKLAAVIAYPSPRP